MSEPLKRATNVPESYSPKTKPEILRVMEENAMSVPANARVVRTSDGGSYIDGVLALRWGEWKDCTYCGAASLLLNMIGADATYEQVMGLTGSCYRFSMCYGWDPGSDILNVNYAYLGYSDGCGVDRNANRAFGYDFVTYADEDERDERVRQSIDAGVPVLALGGRFAPEWNIITGYEITAEGVRYFGRSYFDWDAPENELHTPNRYVFNDKYPGEAPGLFVKLCEKSGEPLSQLDALKVSLETCLKMFSPHKFIGYGAYEFMVESLMKNEYPNAEDTGRRYEGWDICMHFAILLDARRAGYIYLEESAEILSGGNKKKLKAVAALYKDMVEALSAVLDYDKLHSHEYDARITVEPKLRAEIAGALRKMEALERQARVIVADLLENWEV